VSDLHDHTDYRCWLRQWMQERKLRNPRFSYRFLGARLGVDPGYLSHVVHGKAHLSEKDLPALVREAGLGEPQAAYLLDLVQFNKARTPQEVKERYARLAARRGLRSRALDDDQMEFFSDPLHMAVRLAISLGPTDDDWEALGARLVPPVASRKAEHSVRLLERLHLVEKGSEGFWILTDRFVSSGEGWTNQAVRQFQLRTLQNAAEALVTLPRDERDVSTVSLTIPRDRLPELQERVRAFRQSVLQWTADMEACDTGLQVNIQAYPLCRLRPGGAP
jgi:uncharacterized protein (TIGR02147 family)